jgi:hypothetical protein
MARRSRPLSPLAMQSPGGFVDDYGEAVEAKPLKKRGITIFSPDTSTSAIAVSNVESIKETLTPAWDRPDFNMLKVRPRYDGQAHRIPEGDGVTHRKK